MSLTTERAPVSRPVAHNLPILSNFSLSDCQQRMREGEELELVCYAMKFDGSDTGDQVLAERGQETSFDVLLISYGSPSDETHEVLLEIENMSHSASDLLMTTLANALDIEPEFVGAV